MHACLLYTLMQDYIWKWAMAMNRLWMERPFHDVGVGRASKWSRHDTEVALVVVATAGKPSCWHLGSVPVAVGSIYWHREHQRQTPPGLDGFAACFGHCSWEFSLECFPTLNFPLTLNPSISRMYSTSLSTLLHPHMHFLSAGHSVCSGIAAAVSNWAIHLQFWPLCQR